MKKLILPELCSDKELDTLKGQHLDSNWIHHIIDTDTDIYNENGDFILSFRKNSIKNTKSGWNYTKMLSKSLMRGASAGSIDPTSNYFKSRDLVKSTNGWTTGYKVNGSMSKMKINTPVWSNTIGYFNARVGRNKNEPCRMTRFTRNNIHQYNDGKPFVDELSDMYFKCNPTAWKNQSDRMDMSKEYRIHNTPFSTMTINRNFRTGLHKDSGDYGGVAVLSVLERGKYKGGLFMIPKYGIGVDLRDGDVLVADVHQYHCNSEFFTDDYDDDYNDELEPFFTFDKKKLVSGSEYKFDRISFVCYLREKMIECPVKNDFLIPLYNFKIAIPSYKRSDILMDKTFKTLQRYNIPNDMIDIFVADKDEYNIYKKVLPKDINIIVGIKGLKYQRMFMSDYYDDDDNIVYMDDDVEKIEKKVDDKYLVELVGDEFKKLCEEGFKLCYKNGCKNWGVYPVHNAYFMRNTITTDLKYIIGCFYGVINDKECERRNVSHGEDYERTIKYYLKYDNVIRMNDYTIQTKYFAKGGMDAEYEGKRAENIDKQLDILKSLYPDLMTIRQKKNYNNPVLKDKRKN